MDELKKGDKIIFVKPCYGFKTGDVRTVRHHRNINALFIGHTDSDSEGYLVSGTATSCWWMDYAKLYDPDSELQLPEWF